MKIIEWKPVDPNQNIVLPDPWEELRAEGFNFSLYERVRRFALSERENGTLHKYNELIASLGYGYLPKAFKINDFKKDGLSQLQEKMLSAIEELSNEFEGLLPSTLWDTLASLVIRPNPEKEESILNVQKYLAHPWYICDAHLHAMGIAYTLFFHVQSHLSRKTGHVIFHGCGCDHYLGDHMEVDIKFKMPESKKQKVAEEFLDHLLGQTVLIVEKGYPFRLNDANKQSVAVLSLRPLTKTV